MVAAIRTYGSGETTNVFTRQSQRNVSRFKFELTLLGSIVD